jgi:hypothetical protein
MRRAFLPILFFISSACFAQENLFTFNGTGSTGTRNSLTRGYGLDLSATRKVSGGLYLGVNAGVVNFTSMDNPYFPLALNMTYFPLKNRKASAPYLTFQPGYGYYDFQRGSNNNKGDYDGGFTYFAGLGLMTKTAGKTRANFSFGYSSFGMNSVYSPMVDLNNNPFDNITYYNKRGSFGTITLKVGLALQ